MKGNAKRCRWNPPLFKYVALSRQHMYMQHFSLFFLKYSGYIFWSSANVFGIYFLKLSYTISSQELKPDISSSVEPSYDASPNTCQFLFFFFHFRTQCPNVYTTLQQWAHWLFGLKKNLSTINAPPGVPGVLKNHIFFSTNETVVLLR